jgi:L-2-hydroxyglutarate oxidase LhgO
MLRGDPQEADYDLVIVGGGMAGSSLAIALANRVRSASQNLRNGSDLLFEIQKRRTRNTQSTRDYAE